METTQKQTFATLKAWREAAQMSTRKAAAYLGMSQTKYSRLELGKGIVRGLEARRVADLTGVPVDALVGAA